MIPGGYETLFVGASVQIDWDSDPMFPSRHVEFGLFDPDGVLRLFCLPDFNDSGNGIASGFARSQFAMWLQGGDDQQDSVTELSPATIRATGGLPNFYLPEYWSVAWLVTGALAGDQLSNMVYLVDQRPALTAAEGLDIVPPYTPESFLDQTATVAA